jgi:hypothetical protein
MGLLCITDQQYGDHDQEILRFHQFMPRTGDFR